MKALEDLENKLDPVFVKNAPFQLPANAKEALVKWLPWINLGAGILYLLTARALWEWARVTNSLVDYANELSRLYGGSEIVAERFTTVIWLGLIFLVVEAVLYLAAFPLTRDRKKLGWDLMLLALLVNIVYGVVMLFSDYGGITNLFGTVVSSVIGLYLLFQIRGSYGARA